jgi:hypothetical protein
MNRSDDCLTNNWRFSLLTALSALDALVFVFVAMLVVLLVEALDAHGRWR